MSIAEIHLTPEELELFATIWERFNGDLRSNKAQLEKDLDGLGLSWRDPAFERFSDGFANAMRTIHEFIDYADESIPLLRRKAEHAATARDISI